MSKPTFQEIYSGADPELVQELVDFRQRHPYRSLPSGGLDWRYQVDGQGERAILFLAGGIQLGETWFRYMDHFKDRCRVLAVTYPDEVDRMEPVVDALEALCQAENLNALSVVGTSLGGMIAQAFARRCPERVTHLVIANTSHPDPIYARRLRSRLPFMQRMPLGLLQYLTRLRLERSRKTALLRTARLFEAYVIEYTFYFLSRAWMANHYRLIIDFCTSCSFKAADLEHFGGKIQLVESEDDLFPESTRQALRELYPQAPVHRFGKGSGHSPSIVCEQEYMHMLEKFLTDRTERADNGF